MVTKEESMTWEKYKRRIYGAKGSVDNLRNQIITIRANRMDVMKAVELTDQEANKILSDVGVFDTRGREIVTRKDWERDGYRRIQYVTNIPLYKQWKTIVKEKTR